MTDKIQQARRAAFEAKYPLLAGMYWCEETKQYAGNPLFWLYSDRWETFNAALDCVVIDLPAPAKAMAVVIDYQDNKRQNVTGTTNWAANLGMCVVNECRDAIESTNLGIKAK